MMQGVSKRSVLAVILVIVAALFSLAQSSLATDRYWVNRQHNYPYHHHSKLKGALVGGAGGALAGGLIGHGTGALIGAGAGAGGGYLVQKYRNRRERRRAGYR